MGLFLRLFFIQFHLFMLTFAQKRFFLLNKFNWFFLEDVWDFYLWSRSVPKVSYMAILPREEKSIKDERMNWEREEPKTADLTIIAAQKADDANPWPMSSQKSDPINQTLDPICFKQLPIIISTIDNLIILQKPLQWK